MEGISVEKNEKKEVRKTKTKKIWKPRKLVCKGYWGLSNLPRGKKIKKED